MNTDKLNKSHCDAEKAHDNYLSGIDMIDTVTETMDENMAAIKSYYTKDYLCGMEFKLRVRYVEIPGRKETKTDPETPEHVEIRKVFAEYQGTYLSIDPSDEWIDGMQDEIYNFVQGPIL